MSPSHGQTERRARRGMGAEASHCPCAPCPQICRDGAVSGTAASACIRPLSAPHTRLPCSSEPTFTSRAPCIDSVS